MNIQDETAHYCDFCSEQVKYDDRNARIYDAESFSSKELGYGSRGAWLACATCAAFIKQHDDGTDIKAKHNLALRALEKNRRKFGLRGMPDNELNQVLLNEIKKLHDAFWRYRTDTPPIPYTIKLVEG